MPDPTPAASPTPATPTPAATPPSSTPPAGAKAAAAAPADGKTPAATPPAAAPATPPEPKPAPVAPAMAEVMRKEQALRVEKKKFDDDRRAAAAKETERAEKEARWKNDPEALIKDNGWDVDGFLEILSKGGAESPEGRLRAVEARIAAKEKAEKDAEEKRKQDDISAADKRRQDEAYGFVRNEAKRLLADTRFELLQIAVAEADELYETSKARDPQAVSGIEMLTNEAARVIIRKLGEGHDITPEQALVELESALDRRHSRLAQSSKLKAKTAPTPADGPTEEQKKPEAQRQTPTVPPASSKRTITIKPRNQAVAPIRVAATGREPSAEVQRSVAANLAAVFAKAKK